VDKKKTNKTKIGGQAVIEGVMMRGEGSAATAIRSPDGKILISSAYIKKSPSAEKIKKIPVVRGVYNFGASMSMGLSTLFKSAEGAGGQGQKPTKLEKSVAKMFKVDAAKVMTWVALIIGVAFAVGLFVVVPNLLTGLIRFDGVGGFLNGFLKNLTEGVIRITLFVIYISLVSLMDDIKRVFSYHGAEHKVINCYECALPLTVANVKGVTTRHERCGTTFIFIVMLVSVLLFSFLGFGDGILLRLLTRIALLPVVAGIAYEILIFSAKNDNIFFRILRAPGMWLQGLTTREPDEKMLEVSLAAFKTVLAMDKNGDLPVSTFENTVYVYSYVRDRIREELKDYPIDESDWIIAAVLRKGRAALPLTDAVALADFEKMEAYAAKRKTGMPLQRVFGYVEFFGCKIAVGENTLIPRPETEILTDEVKKYALKKIAQDRQTVRILDLCTGSGAIAVALKKALGGGAEVVASDISLEALAAARSNAEANGADVTFVQSDLLDNIEIGGGFDIIVSNPPYIRTDDIDGLDREVRDFEPRIALDGGIDGLDFYRRINAAYRRLLKDGGALFVECGAGQSRDIEAIFLPPQERQDGAADGKTARIINDYNGIERIIAIHV
jgi:release factor-specific protein-(glutamine-N5) methyltransferase